MIPPREISCAAAKWQAHLRFLFVGYLKEDTG